MTETQEERRHGVVRGLLVLLLSGPIGLIFYISGRSALYSIFGGYVVTFGLGIFHGRNELEVIINPLGLRGKLHWGSGLRATDERVIRLADEWRRADGAS